VCERALYIYIYTYIFIYIYIYIYLHLHVETNSRTNLDTTTKCPLQLRMSQQRRNISQLQYSIITVFIPASQRGPIPQSGPLMSVVRKLKMKSEINLILFRRLQFHATFAYR
jgi:hypothetical protein